MDYKFAMHSRCCAAHMEMVRIGENLQLVCEKCKKVIPEISIEGDAPSRSSCCDATYEPLYTLENTFVITCTSCGKLIEGLKIKGPDLSDHECECCGATRMTFEEMVENSKKDLAESISRGEEFIHKAVGLRDMSFVDIWPIVVSENDKLDTFMSVGAAIATGGCNGVCILMDTNLTSHGDVEDKSNALVVMYLDFTDLSNIQTRMIRYVRKGKIVSFITEDTEGMDEFGGMVPSALICGFAYYTIASKCHRGENKSKAIKDFYSEYLNGIEKYPEFKNALSEIINNIEG